MSAVDKVIQAAGRKAGKIANKKAEKELKKLQKKVDDKEVGEAVEKAVINILTVLKPDHLKTVKKLWGTNPGSKVRGGAFAECPIELDGDKAYIVVNKEKGEVVFLTKDFIQSCEYKEEKKKLAKGKLHTYFYYEITFKDGRKSSVRMRRKYKEAMEHCGVHIS